MAILVEGLRFGYGRHEVIREASFSVPEGQVTCLLGRNGSGKTTLIRLLNGILRPKAGAIAVDGCDVRTTARRETARRLAFVPQEHHGVFAYGVTEMVVMGRNPYLSLVSRPGPADYQAAAEALDTVGIGYLADRGYMEISGGERQLVLIARALTQETPYLLMDEPTSHLDFTNQHGILATLRQIARTRGTGVLVALHDPNLAITFPDRVIMLQEGRIHQEGPVEQVVTRENLERLYQVPIDVAALPDGRRVILSGGGK